MFTALLLALVLGMGSIVLLYARRSLRSEPYRRRFTIIGALLVAASTTLVLAGDLLVVACAWVATSALAVALIETGPGPREARRATRARRSFAIGDIAVVLAIATLVASADSTSVADVDRAGSWALSAAGVLLVVAAATRCASGPFLRWLPDSLGAPTPSSALLHAGVVNGGAILLIKLAPATAGPLPPALLAVTVGAVTCAIGLAVARTRPDVKGQLAWSTIAQMSFTLALCGLGLHIAAGLHLVAHGAFKGTRFLGSGGTVRQGVRARRAPSAATRQPHLGHVVAVLAAAAAIVASGAHVHGDLLIAAALATFAAGSAIEAGLRRSSSLVRTSGTVLGGVGLLVAYLALTVQLEHAVGDELGVAAPALGTWWLVAGLVGLVLAVTVAQADVRRASLVALGRPTAPRALVLPQRPPRPARRRPPQPPRPEARPQPEARPVRPALAPFGA